MDFALLRVKIRLNVSWDFQFVRESIPGYRSSRRWFYLLRKYWAILRNSRRVKFLGHSFRYDNRFMPALLQEYPREIMRFDTEMNFSKLRTVMDVGANIGQFGFVLKTLFPKLHVYSFEPNPEAFGLLRENCRGFSDWTHFNFGLGPKSESAPFYVVPEKSAQGSLYASNAALNLLRTDYRELKVELMYLSEEALRRYDIPKIMDFIKIDVEGFEIPVLRSLKNIEWRYMYLELSIARDGAISVADVLTLITEIWGRVPRIVRSPDASSAGRHCANLVLEMPRLSDRNSSDHDPLNSLASGDKATNH